MTPADPAPSPADLQPTTTPTSLRERLLLDEVELGARVAESFAFAPGGRPSG